MDGCKELEAILLQILTKPNGTKDVCGILPINDIIYLMAKDVMLKTINRIN